MPKRLLLALSLAAVFCTAWPGLGQAQDETPTTAAGWLAQHDARIAALQEQLAATPDAQELWQQLVMLRGMRFSIERNANGAPPTPEESRQVNLDLVAEWIAAQPDAAEPYLARASLLPQAERAPYLLEQEDHLGDNPVYLSRLLQTLAYDGDLATASRLVDATLNRGAERAEYEVVHTHLSHSDQGARLDEVIDRWLLEHPSDPAAHAAFLQRQASRNATPEAVRAAAQRAIDSFEGSAFDGTIRLCGAIRSRGRDQLDDLVEACYGKLLAAELDEEERGRALEGLATFVAGRGRGDEAAQMLREIPEKRRPAVMQRLMEAEITAGRCGEAIVFAGGFGTTGSSPGVALAKLLDECGTEPELRDDLMAWATSLDGEATRYLLDRWYQRSDPQDAIELGERYLERDPTNDSVRRSLDRLLERHGELVLREEYLRRWLADPAAGAGGNQRKDLADLLLRTGRAEEAIGILREGLASEEGNSRDFLLGPLAETLIRSGRWVAADALIAELAMSSQDYWQARARYLGAQSAWLQGHEELAFERLEAYLEEADSPEQEAIASYAALAADLGRDDDLDGTLARLYDKLHDRGLAGGGLAAWAADQLEQAGRPDLARQYLQAALAEAPDDAKLLQSLGRVEGQLGEASGSAYLRQSLEADPYNTTRWRQLVQQQVAAGDIEGALASLAEAYGLFEAPPQALQIEEARIRFSQAAYLEVVRLLRPIVRVNQYATRALELLRDAYRKLGEGA